MNDTLMGIHGSVVAETQTVTRADIHKFLTRVRFRTAMVFTRKEKELTLGIDTLVRG